MIKYLLRTAIASLGLAFFLGSGVALAYANTPPIDPSYNNRIIDDSLFTSSGTMSTQDIQNFLNSKVPTCDTNHQGGLSQYPPPYTCLKDYVDPTTGKRAAQLIHDEAAAVGLNPQVILVTLEKEQGLVTDTWPYPTQYKFAMGYGCPESQSVCDAQYNGFYNQVHLGATLLRVGLDRDCGNNSSFPGWSVSSQWQRGNSPSVDGVGTYLANCATGSLYNYTPHRPDSAYTLRGGVYYYGNYNFISYFNSWFGSTLAYNYQFLSAINPPSVMQPGQTVTASVVLKNTGAKIWWDETNAALSWNEDPDGGGSPTPMRLYTTQPGDHANPFGGGSGWVGQSRMTMLSGKAGPGDPATFQFSYTAPTTPGTYTEHFAPTIENVIKMRDAGMAFTVTVPKVYSYDFVSATNPPSTMLPGQTAEVSVTIKNTGNVTWGNESNQSATPARLFTTRPTDHNNPFGGGSGWVNKVRMVMQTASVAPGQNATFVFDYTAPNTPGSYTEYFAPTIENVAKMKDVGMAFTVSVPEPYRYSFVSAANPPSTMSPGQKVQVSVTLKNTGARTWYNEAGADANKDPAGGGAPTPVRLFTTRPTDHNNPFGGGSGWVNKVRMVMQTASVAPGQNGTFVFDYTAPNTIGNYTEYFAPTIENVLKMSDVGMAFGVRVQ